MAVAELPELEPVFGEAKLELAESASPSGVFLLLYVHAPDSSHLKIQVTDFRSRTWEAVRSASQLEDMRDNIGIGGSWSDFIDYLMASIKSQDVKIVLETHAASESSAKLVAQKSKGMPRISFSLTKLVASAATDANANLSMELFKALKRLQYLCGQEQECSSKMTKPVLSSHQQHENNTTTSIQGQVEELRHKPCATLMMTDDGHNSPDKAARDRVPTKGANRVVSAFRRAKVRGVVLQDDDEDGN